jgi:hypothetical protein
MQRHKTKALYKGPCHECKKQTIVAMVSPCPDHKDLTGVWIRRMDEDFNYHNVGFLCKDCMNFENPKYSFGFDGGEIDNLSNWEAFIVPAKESEGQST